MKTANFASITKKVTLAAESCNYKEDPDINNLIKRYSREQGAEIREHSPFSNLQSPDNPEYDNPPATMTFFTVKSEGGGLLYQFGIN